MASASGPVAPTSAENGSSGMEVDPPADGVASALDHGPRRSLRKREEKSYAESPDLIIEEVGDGSNGRNSDSGTHNSHGGGVGSSAVAAIANHHKKGVPADSAPNANSNSTSSVAAALSNGDVEMHSEDEDAGGKTKAENEDDDDDDGPLEEIPLPKVSPQNPSSPVRHV